MKLRALLASALAILLTTFSTAHSQLLYWDTNGATAGSTNTPPDAPGTWNAVALNWSTDSSGASATQAWTPNATAVFSAGSDATGTFNVTLSGTQSASGVAFQEGAVTLTGGTGLTLTGAGIVSVGPAAPVVGDYNGDGVTDAADYVAWRKDPAAFGGDPAGYDSWRTNFGTVGGVGGPATLATINSVIGGSAGLTKSGSGTLVLGGANTYTGDTTMASGGGTLRLAATNTLPAATVVNMGPNNGGGRVELFDGSTYYNQTIAGLEGGGGGTTSPTVVDVGFAELTLNIPSGESHTYNGFLKTDFDQSNANNVGKVVVNGPGEFIIGGSNNNATFNFGGQLIVNGGRVGFTNNVGVGSATGTARLIINNGATLVKANAATTSMTIGPRTVDINGSFTFDMTGSQSDAQFLPALPASGLGGINLNGNATITVTAPVDPSFPANTPLGFTPAFILGRVITDGANSFAITKDGPGLLTLNQPNDYNGGTTILNGTLRVAAQLGALGDGPVFLSGGTLNYTGAPVSGVRSHTIDNSITVTADSGISLRGGTGGSGFTPGAEFKFTTNSFTGTGGTLSLRNESNSNEPNIGDPYSNPVLFTVTFTGEFTFSRPVVIANHTDPLVANLRTTVLNSANTSGTQTWSGDISGNGGYVRNGAGGTSVLSGNNTYTGDTKVLAGTLSITNPYLADTADVYLLTGSIFDLDTSGATDTIDQLFVDGVSQGPGTYGFGAMNPGGLFTGSGFLLVTSAGSGGAVPEPGALALAMLGLCVLGAGRRRRG